MRYKGDIKVIEEIQELFTSKAKYYVTKDGAGGQHTTLKDDSHSRVFSREFLLFLNELGTVSVKLGFDYRDKSGEIHMRDDKAWRIAATLPDFALLMYKLEPFYHNRQRYRGEFMKSMDKLFVD